jgi:hypothetical protein
MHFGGRKLGQQSLTQLLQIAVRVFHDLEILAESLVDDVSQPLFLLVAKNIGRPGSGGQSWHGARPVWGSGFYLLRRLRLGLSGDLKK